MELEVLRPPTGTDGSLIVMAPYFGEESLTALSSLIRPPASAARLAETRQISSELHQLTYLPADATSAGILFVGAGSRNALDGRLFLQLVATASRYLSSRGGDHVAIADLELLEVEEFARAAVEGAVTGAYDAGVKKTGAKERKTLTMLRLVSGRESEALRHGMERGNIVGEGINLARDLVNLPPNEVTPRALAERARELAGVHGLECEVLVEDELERLGMGSFLGVAAGSDQPPRLIKLQYGNPASGDKLAFVGKGLTFDSGGLSLKTAGGMENMKGDMAGAAAVIAGMVSIARLAPAGVFATGYVGATENMPGGSAMRPGDVLHAMNGKTIEVLNTDAEGRLVLADLLAFAQQQGATHIIDFATLTGGAIVALGLTVTLTTGKPEAWVSRAVGAARSGFEQAWPMPLYPEYRRAMKSEVADIKNVGGQGASALTAAAFLGDFVDGPSWAHMDIAGTAWNPEATSFAPPGGTGAGVATIVGVALDMASPDHARTPER